MLLDDAYDGNAQNEDDDPPPPPPVVVVPAQHVRYSMDDMASSPRLVPPRQSFDVGEAGGRGRGSFIIIGPSPEPKKKTWTTILSRSITTTIMGKMGWECVGVAAAEK
jgi:hypothetical protein